MHIQLPTPKTVKEYVEDGFISSLPLTEEEKNLRSETEKAETKRKQWPYDSAPVDRTITPRLAAIAQAYFDKATSTVEPEVQAILFHKAREVAQEISHKMNPSLDPLIADSIFQEALACEKVAQSALQDSEKFLWVLRGASTITPTPEEIKDRILDPLHLPEKYTKGSQLWETAAKLAGTAPLPFSTEQLNPKNDLMGRLHLSVFYLEAAARCTQRAFVLSSLQTENVRLLKLLKNVIATLKMIQAQDDLAASLQSKIVKMQNWKHNFSPEDPAKAEKISKKYLKVAALYKSEAEQNKSMEDRLLLQEALHTHSAALLAPSLKNKTALLQQSVSMAVALKKRFLTISQHPLFNTIPLTFKEHYQIDWAWAQELAQYEALLQKKS